MKSQIDKIFYFEKYKLMSRVINLFYFKRNKGDCVFNINMRRSILVHNNDMRYYDTSFCKTLDGSAELAADPAKFYLTHRQMRAEGIFAI